MSTEVDYEVDFFKDIILKHYQLQIIWKMKSLNKKTLQTTNFLFQCNSKSAFFFWGGGAKLIYSL